MKRGIAGMALALLLLAMNSVPAAAQGRGDDVGIDLFLDTRDLLESGAGDPPLPAPDVSEAPQKPRKPGDPPVGGPQWEWDPIFLRNRTPGDPRGGATTFRDSDFGVEIRRRF